MKATIDMYEVVTEQLRKTNKRGRVNKFVWIARIGPVIRICPSEKSAAKYLENLGFRLNDKLEWELTHRPIAEIYIEMHYRKVSP